MFACSPGPATPLAPLPRRIVYDWTLIEYSMDALERAADENLQNVNAYPSESAFHVCCYLLCFVL